MVNIKIPERHPIVDFEQVNADWGKIASSKFDWKKRPPKTRFLGFYTIFWPDIYQKNRATDFLFST